MTVLASAALAGSLLATDAQARGGGGHGAGGGVGHMGGFAQARMGARLGGVAGARVGGIDGRYMAGIPQGAVGYGTGTGYRTGTGYGTGILRGRYAVLAASAFAQNSTTPTVSSPAPEAVQNPQIRDASPETFSGRGLTIVGRNGSSSKTVGMAAASSASAPSNTQNQQTTSAIRSGNLVRLRSGGPLMTVKDIKGDQVDCFWTDFNGQINADNFPVDVLQMQ
jgi:uncharacterized protein YodC (DUF2158 family)